MTAILIDARRSQGVRTGVGHYTKSIIENWPDGSPAPTCLLRPGEEDSKLSRGTSIVLPAGLRWHIAAARMARRGRALYFSPESMFVPLMVGRRALLTVHDLTPLTNPGVHKRWNVLLHRAFMGFTLRRVGAVIVPTETVRRDVISLFPWAARKTHVIVEGVRSRKATTQAPDAIPEVSRPYALYVGTIEPRKNVIPLIEAFLDAAPSTWTLAIAGKIGWLNEEDRERFARLAEHPRVNHLGFVPDGWLPSLYQWASVFCYVSDAEGFGLPVAEAMAAGTPVIHSDDPALLEVGQGVGLVVRRSHLADDLRQAIRRVSSMPDREVEEQRQRARQASAKFDWAVASAETSLILNRLKA